MVTENRELFFEKTIGHISWKQLRQLWELLMESDVTNLEELENRIYAYGSSLGAKDHLGRVLFSRMALLLHRAQSTR